MDLHETLFARALGGSGGGSGGGSAEKKWLLKKVACTSAALNATGIVPEAGKYYVLCNGGSGTPTSVAKCGSDGTLRFYASTGMGTVELEYTESGGWSCTNSFHALYGTTVSICEWE